MKKELKQAFTHEIAAGINLYRKGDLARAFYYFERAHILGQKFVFAHTKSHWWMLRVGWARRDLREIIGQITRIIASLIASRIWVPVGNTGGSNVHPLRKMEVPQDLAEILKTNTSRTRTLIGRLWLALVVLVSLLLIIAIVFLSVHHYKQADIDANWQREIEAKASVVNIGSVETLSVLPLVNWHKNKKLANDQLQTEVGVSYLIKTDLHTILFDLGQNSSGAQPSPLENNMKLIGVNPNALDAIFISHLHFDHVGGNKWADVKTFSFGIVQHDLKAKQVFVPTPMSYPKLTPVHTPNPRELLTGVATSGTIARQLLIGRIDEQALVINVKNVGLILIIGCGHQTLTKLINRVERFFHEPIAGIIGDLHYPIPTGRIKFLGMNGQRVFASGRGPFSQIEMSDVHKDIELLKERNPKIVALGGHDSSDQVIEHFNSTFGDKYQHVRVGDWIAIE